MIIAGIEVVVQTFIPDSASYRLVLVFALVVTVLMLRPSGLLGRVVIQKV